MEWRYTRPAVWLHWIVALMVAGLLGLGWYMMSVEHEPGTRWLFRLHKSIGVLAFAVILLRVLWRATHRPEPLPAPMPAWQIKLSHLVQWSLYACMVIMPALGIVGAAYSKSGIAVFGVKFPDVVTPDHDTAEQFFGLHSTVAWVMVALIALHAVGGLKHLLVDKDRVFQRMWR
ncbi:MAG: cytochrome b [Massilia sp.]